MLYLNIRSLGFIQEHFRDTDALGGPIVIEPNNLFNSCWEDKWIESDFGRRIITEIDGKDIRYSKDARGDLAYKYRMAPQQLCTGTKNCLLAKFYTTFQRIYMAFMGPNCFKFLLEASDNKNIKATLNYFAPMTPEDIRGHKIYFEDLSKICTTAREYVDCLHECDTIGLFDDDLPMLDGSDKNEKD